MLSGFSFFVIFFNYVSYFYLCLLFNMIKYFWGDYMKKRLLLTLTVLGAFVFAGCGKKTTKNTTKENTTAITTKQNVTTKTNSTTKEDEVISGIEYEQDNTIRHETKRNSKGVLLSLMSAYKGEGYTDYKYYAKQEMNYNSSNQLVKKTYYKYDEEKNEWVFNVMSEYTYNSENKEAVVTEYNYDDVAKEFKPNLRTTNYYANGKRVSYEYEKYNGEEFVYNSKYTYTYEGDNIKINLQQTWSASTSSWVNKSQSVNTYENNLMVSFIDYTWKSDSWKKAARGEVDYYPGTNNEKYYTYYEWSDSANDYIPYSKMYFEYDSEDRIILQIGSDYIDGEWIYDTKYVTTYPYADAGTYESITYNYNKTTNNWENSYKYGYVFDELCGACALSRGYKWDKTTETWILEEYE